MNVLEWWTNTHWKHQYLTSSQTTVYRKSSASTVMKNKYKQYGHQWAMYVPLPSEILILYPSKVSGIVQVSYMLKLHLTHLKSAFCWHRTWPYGSTYANPAGFCKTSPFFEEKLFNMSSYSNDVQEQERCTVTQDSPDWFLLDERLHLAGAQQGAFAAWATLQQTHSELLHICVASDLHLHRANKCNHVQTSNIISNMIPAQYCNTYPQHCTHWTLQAGPLFFCKTILLCEIL